jgi:hypothetical protein
MTNEADMCRKFVMAKLQPAGLGSEPHSIANHCSGRSNYYGKTDLVRLFFDAARRR